MSDGLPGVIVDRYGDFLVCQFLSAGAEYWKYEIVRQLRELVPHRGIYERSDLDVREKEGLPPSSGLLCGQKPPDLVEIQEGPVRFCVDIRHGHKTGFYLDQRENRSRIPGFCNDADLFQKIAAGAAVDARIDGQILQRLSQASDHATALNFSEGTFLKGLVCRVS